MSKILVAYGTTEGQTAAVAEHAATVLREADHRVSLVELGDVDSVPELTEFDGFIVAASVHAGKHQRAVVDFVRTNRVALEAKPAAFMSTSLSAASPETRPDAEKVIDAFLADTGWEPDAVLPVGGALRYSQYGFLKRIVMRSISGRNRGDTDTSRDYEYTDWAAVTDFVTDFEAILDAGDTSSESTGSPSGSVPTTDP